MSQGFICMIFLYVMIFLLVSLTTIPIYFPLGVSIHQDLPGNKKTQFEWLRKSYFLLPGILVSSRTRVLPSPLDCLVAYLNLEWASWVSCLLWGPLAAKTETTNDDDINDVITSSRLKFLILLCILSWSVRMCWRTSSLGCPRDS